MRNNVAFINIFDLSGAFVARTAIQSGEVDSNRTPGLTMF